MSETGATIKPAEAAQALAGDKTQPEAENAQAVETEEQPEKVHEESAGAGSAQADPASAEQSHKHSQTEAVAAGQKVETAEAEATAGDDEVKANTQNGKSEGTEAGAEAAEAKTDGRSQKSKMLKTTASIDRANIRNNRKFDPSAREITDDPVAIRKQVEFYFGDWNFPQDKFMWETCEGEANKPMPISKIHSFKRMRSFQPYSAVVAALRESKLLEVAGEEGAETVKRKVPYKPMADARAKAEASTVYVKGFGDENPNTQFDLESFFAKFGEIKGLRLRRTPEGLFKGSVFVTFPDEEAAKKFIGLDPAPTYKDHELKIMSKRNYCEEKSELIRQGKLEPSGNMPKKFFEGKEGRRGGRGNHRGGRDGGDDWKARREHDQKTGFQDRRGGGRGRGGRGRGRGRGSGRGGRDGVGRDRDSHKDNGEKRRDVDDGVPRIQSTTAEGQEKAGSGKGKREREEDGAGDGAPAAKKLDVKEAGKTEAC